MLGVARPVVGPGPSTPRSTKDEACATTGPAAGSTSPPEPSADAVVLRVVDSGPGIPADQIERLFVPFDRLGLQDGPGAGPGMVLDRGPTQAMGGTLSVRSTLGTGTTMHLRLPIA